MKYHLTKNDDFFIIKISGEPKKNEALPAKRVLRPYLKERGIRVIMDLKELEKFEPITLLGVLNGMRKEIDLSGGCLKLCSLKLEILDYFKENRMDQFFHIYEDEEGAKKSEWGNYGKR
ncbi:MAG: STAS domain-containing protein [Desulfobacterales bacterium]|nr:STAS domain-containing protein [Desulfobacterales bacterium]